MDDPPTSNMTAQVYEGSGAASFASFAEKLTVGIDKDGALRSAQAPSWRARLAKEEQNHFGGEGSTSRGIPRYGACTYQNKQELNPCRQPQP